MAKDISPLEYRKHIQDFLPMIGLKAEVYTSIETQAWKKHPYSAGLYPHGITNSHRGYLHVEAPTLADLWGELQAKWAEHRDRHRLEVTRKMALAVIRLTTELGECTDAALRTEFDPAEIKSYGEDACAEANAMAGRGPFSIAMKGGANGAPDLEVA
ncbi:hypothetical protein ABIF26_009557 [Bradyrhizobium elkanii]|uniref:hypothetical protein n=1 Tax=Bradyrhizobium elkanii TaxID=29448 RepID=UPI0035167A61